MIYDCFTFYNELDVLEIRLNTLENFVDRFVLVEATRTHSNLSKPLYFNENKNRFAKFNSKIIHIIVDEFPEYENSWTIENYQRNCISRALINCGDDDLILISDVDEIPRPETLLKVAENSGITCLLQDLYFYYLNYVDLNNLIWAGGTKVLKYRAIRNNLLDEKYVVYNPDTFPEHLNLGPTFTKIRLYTDCTYISDGGWHFSYLGGAEAIRKKFQAFAHQEYNKSELLDTDRLNRLIEDGRDVFGRTGHTFAPVLLDDSFPEYVRSNPDKCDGFVFKRKLRQIPQALKISQTVAVLFKEYVKKIGGYRLRKILKVLCRR